MPNTAQEKHPEETSTSLKRKVLSISVVGLVTAVSVLIALGLAEAGFRLIEGISLTDGSNWRIAGVRTKRIGERAELDDRLGWTLKSDFRSDEFNTIGLGIRRNFDEQAVRKGSILAVGDSFTEGFDEVDDKGTWPSHLEKMLGVPVVNAGVAGYAADQIFLRVEQLIPLIEPKTLIVGLTEVDIYRSALSDAGAPKPYYMIEKGELVYYPPGPVELKTTETMTGAALRSVLSYSALSDHLFSRLAPAFWYPHMAANYKEVENQPLQIICRLLDKTKRLTEEKNIRMILFMQYAGELVLEETSIIPDMQTLTDCAQKLGIQVVDQFKPLRELTHGDMDLVAQYYAVQGEEYGHMVTKGNQHAAQLLADALSKPPEVPSTAPANAALEAEKPVQN
jgi:hypothetical protein